MKYYGIIGQRETINPLIDDRITNPFGNASHPWLYFEPKTGAPHGESPTICTNLSLKWLRESAAKCEFVIYFIPGCGIGGALYNEQVESDDDFIEPHTTLHQKKKHARYTRYKKASYFSYIEYLLSQFPNLYLSPLESFQGIGDSVVEELLIRYPTRVLDPSVFAKAEVEKLELIKELISQNKEETNRLLRQVRARLGERHRNAFHAALKLEYSKEPVKSNISFGIENAISFCCFDSKFFQIALRHLISLRTLGGFSGEVLTLLSPGEWEDWQLAVLKKLGVEILWGSESPKYHYMIQRFVDLAECLKGRETDLPLIHFDTDIWFQRKFSDVIKEMSEGVCFGTWHGHDILLKERYKHHREKYLRILSKTAAQKPQRPGVISPHGGIPHGGFHGGPFSELLRRYRELPNLVCEGWIPNARTGDELGLFLTCNEERDRFDLDRHWTSCPSTIDLVTREISDEYGEVKPVLHFENSQKTSSLADFFIVYPDIVSRAIEEYDLYELKEYGRLTAWHLRS